jgi:heme o synthase
VELFKKYIAVTKPGIIRANVMTAAAGFLLASGRTIDWWQLVATCVGVALVIACACVCNNYIDRGIDKKMARTKERALVKGTISPVHAFVFAGVLGVVGFGTLALYTNRLTVALGVLAFVFYVGIYAVVKRTTTLGTIIGSVAGALPVTAGYVAARGAFDTGALLVFLVLTCWQMPHFYAIALYRLKDYKAAGLPVLPAVKGNHRAKLSILGYIVLFVVVTSLLTTFGYTGYVYLVGMTLVGVWWLYKALKGFNSGDDAAWARKLFGMSLMVLLAFSVLISLDAWLP